MDRAARAAGTIYRVAAGTESLDIGTTNKQATRSTDDDTDNIHNDNTDTTSRKTGSGYSFNGVMRFPFTLLLDFFFLFLFFCLFCVYLLLSNSYTFCYILAFLLTFFFSKKKNLYPFMIVSDPFLLLNFVSHISFSRSKFV